MLQNPTTELATAELLADRIVYLCGRGETVDTELAELGRAVSALTAAHPHGLPAALADRGRTVLTRVNAALTAAERQQADTADELETLAAHRRVRHAYLRPPT